MSCTDTSTKLLVIGHRGAMGHETENTLPSIRKALELDVDMIEIDVFKIKSGELVVFHDDEVDALTNGTGKIEDYSLQELQELEVVGGHRIPELHEVLDVIDKKVALNIELKGSQTAKDVNTLVLNYIKEKDWKLEQFVISSFNWQELREARKANEKLAVAVLTESDPLDALQEARDLNAVAINPNFRTLTKQNVGQLHEAGFKVYTWTVNEVDDIRRMERIGVDGVFTDYPERAH